MLDACAFSIWMNGKERCFTETLLDAKELSQPLEDSALYRKGYVLKGSIFSLVLSHLKLHIVFVTIQAQDDEVNLSQLRSN